MFKKINSSNHVRKFVIPILLFLILFVLIINHLKIMFYIKNDEHDCNSNQSIFESDQRSIELKVKFPNSLESIEHLQFKKDNIFKSELYFSKNRRATFVIGISTIKRENISYLNTTLDSLFLSMSHVEKNQALVVVLLSEVIILKMIFLLDF